MTKLPDSPVAITTITGGQEGKLDDGDYENGLHAKEMHEEMHEDPSSPPLPLQQPLPGPTIPPPAALPTTGNVGGAGEEPIPGDD